MAIKLTSKPNTSSPTGSYPYGNIKDDSSPGANDGTPVNTLVYADIHQYFERMMDLAGVTHSGQPDNATNSFQYVEALYKVLEHANWTTGGAPVLTPYGGGSVSAPGGSTTFCNRYKNTGKTFKWQLDFQTTVTGTVNEIRINLPITLTSITLNASRPRRYVYGNNYGDFYVTVHPTYVAIGPRDATSFGAVAQHFFFELEIPIIQ